MVLFFLAGLKLELRHARGSQLRLVAIAFAGALALALVEAPLLIAILLAATAFGIVVAVLKDAHETRTRFGQLVIAAASLAGRRGAARGDRLRRLHPGLLRRQRHAARARRARQERR